MKTSVLANGVAKDTARQPVPFEGSVRASGHGGGPRTGSRHPMDELASPIRLVVALLGTTVRLEGLRNVTLVPSHGERSFIP